VNVIEIETTGVSIDFEEAATFLGRVDETIEIDCITRPFAEEPTRRVREDSEERVVHCPNDARGLRVDIKLEPVVDGTDSEVESLEDTVRQVELAVGENIDLAGFEKLDPLKLVV
jgi:hypothetical protein